jgi:spermidine/putrescine-binding protein
VNKAQGDIMDTLDDPALSGDPKAAELRGAVKTYAGGKISNSLMRIKNDINKAIENNRIGLGKRFVILSAANKLGYSGSLEGIDRYDEQLRNSINNADIPDEAKQELKQLNNQLREWKAYQVYSKRMESFRQKVDALGESRKDIFEDLARQVDTVNTDSDFDRAGQLIEKIRQVSLVEEDSLIEDAENMLRLKRIMLASKEISQLRERLKESGESVDKPPELEDALSAVEESAWQKEVLER